MKRQSKKERKRERKKERKKGRKEERNTGRKKKRRKDKEKETQKKKDKLESSYTYMFLQVVDIKIVEHTQKSKRYFFLPLTIIDTGYFL